MVICDSKRRCTDFPDWVYFLRVWTFLLDPLWQFWSTHHVSEAADFALQWSLSCYCTCVAAAPPLFSYETTTHSMGSVQYSAWRGGGDREEEKEEIERLMLKSNRAFNETWVFTASFGGNIRLWQPIPAKVRNELFAALSLSLLA